MPATQFICPNHDKILIRMCLRNCPHANRCMAKPTLNAVAASVKPRGLGKYSVTELLNGSREVYFKKLTDYAVDPQDLMFAMHGSAVHLVGEENSDEDIMTEKRLENDIYTGKIDAYGDILGNGKRVLLDYKVTSNYKAMIALGYHQVEENTGEVYKVGAKKGQPKTRKVWKPGGRKHIFEWALQVNAYRMLLEEAGYDVDEMYIQIYIRDYSERIAKEGVITKPIHLVKVNPISDHWIRIYFGAKRDRLTKAFITDTVPETCSKRETWDGRKCDGYCDVKDSCVAYQEAVKNEVQEDSSSPNAA